MKWESKREFKDALFEQFARAAKALSSGRRLELLEVLAQGERSVEELADQVGLTVANASQHLQVLRSARLVDMRRDGLYARYRLTNERALKLWLALREFGEEEVAEIQLLVRKFLQERNSFEAITMDELRARLKKGDVVLIDVRPDVEYASGHIPGALSIPLDQLEEQLKRLPKRKTIVAYCRGPYCVFADEAVRVLRNRGHRAHRLEIGFPEWKVIGLPTEDAASIAGGAA